MTENPAFLFSNRSLPANFYLFVVSYYIFSAGTPTTRSPSSGTYSYFYLTTLSHAAWLRGTSTSRMVSMFTYLFMERERKKERQEQIDTHSNISYDRRIKQMEKTHSEDKKYLQGDNNK